MRIEDMQKRSYLQLVTTKWTIKKYLLAAVILEWLASPVQEYTETVALLVQMMLMKSYPQLLRSLSTKVGLLMPGLEGEIHAPKDDKDLLLPE